MIEKRIDDDQIDIFYFLEGAMSTIKRLWLILLIVFIVATSSFTFLKHSTYKPMYETKITVSVIKKTDPTFYYNIDAAKQVQEVFSQVLKSELLYSIIQDDLNIPYLPGYYTCNAIDETNLLVISAYSNDSKKSFELVESLMANYDQVSSLIMSDVRLSVIGDIIEPTKPNNPFELVSVIIKGAMMGIVLDCLLVAFDVVFRKTIQREKDIKKQLNTKCLACLTFISKKRRTKEIKQTMLLGINQLPDSFLEGLRLLRHHIESDARKHKNKVYVFSSTIPGEGKTTVSSNVALSLASNGKKVLLIDGDLRKPSISRNFNQTIPYTISDFLYEKCEIEEIICLYKDSLYFIGNNDSVSNPTELLSSSRCKQLIQELRGKFDFIIIDTPPTREMSDASILSEMADASIMVVREDVVPVKEILEAMQHFVYNSHNLLGCVLNCTSASDNRYGYHYYGRYINRRQLSDG